MLTHPLIASEAISTIDVPIIKAWDHDENGNVLILQRLTVTSQTDRTIEIRDDKNRSNILPLFITAKYIAEQFKTILYNQNLLPDKSRAPDYFSIVEDAYATGVIDRRLCPESRVALENGIAFHQAGDKRHSAVDAIAGAIARAEMISLRKRTVVKTLGYSRGATGIAKLINAILWKDIYRHDVACAAVLLKGRSADTQDYNDAMNIWEASETHRFGLKDLLSTHRPAAIHTIEDHSRINEELLEKIAAFPATLRKAGLKPAVWRMLLRMSVPQNVAIRPLVQSAAGIGHHGTLAFFDDPEVPFENTLQSTSIKILNRLADLGAQDCPATILRTMARMTQHHLIPTEKLLTPILDRGRWARKRGMVKETARLLPLIADAYAAFSQEGLQIANGRGATWDAMIRAQHEWHRQQVLATPVKDVKWQALLPEYTTKIASARELTTSEELFAEGQEMNHCVGGYSPQCISGRSRIFSIVRADGKRRSTLQASLEPSGKWRVSQHYGMSNTTVDPKLKAWEGTLLRALQREQKRSMTNAIRMAA